MTTTTTTATGLKLVTSLAEWAERNPDVYVGTTPNGMRWIADQQTDERHDRWQLWRLTDYVVTSVTGGTIWLQLRKDTTS